MTSNPRVLWIDDSQTRRELAKSLGKEIGDVTAVHPEELATQTDGLSGLGTYLRKGRFDLIVLDYDLQQDTFAATRTRFSGRAPLILGAVRDAATEALELLDVAVYVVSGHFNEPMRDWHYVELSEFDGILTPDDITDPGFPRRLASDALEYRRARDIVSTNQSLNRTVNAEIATALANPPATAHASFLEASAWFLRRPRALPTVSGSTWRSTQGYSSLAIRNSAALLEFVRWLRYALMRLPGALLDAGRAAVHLGMTGRAFEKRAEIFRPALYTGLFAGTDGAIPLWWRAELDALALSRPSANVEASIATHTPLAFSLDEREIAHCSVAARDGKVLRADVLGYPEGTDILSSDAERHALPVARMNASPATDFDLPEPFDRVYRIPKARARQKSPKSTKGHAKKAR